MKNIDQIKAPLLNLAKVKYGVNLTREQLEVAMKWTFFLYVHMGGKSTPESLSVAIEMALADPVRVEELKHEAGL